MRSSSSSSEIELASSGTSRRNRCASFTREFSLRRPPRGGRSPASGCADTVAEDNAGTPSAARCLASSCCLRRLCCCISALPNLPTRGGCIGDGVAMGSAPVSGRGPTQGGLSENYGTGNAVSAPPSLGRTPQATPRTQCLKGRLEGWSAAPAVSTQVTRAEWNTVDTLVLRRSISAFAHASCVLCLGRPTPLSRYSRGSCTFVPRSELNSRNARVPFVAQFIAAHTMTPTMMAWHVHQPPRAGPNLVAAKVPLMLNPPRRRAHDGAPSASRRPRHRRPLRRHPRRQRPRWWRPQRGAAAAARRAGWRCGYRVRYTRRS